MDPIDRSYPIDPETQRQVEQFQQQIAQSGQFYKEAFQALRDDRVMKDLEALYRPQQAREPLLRPVVNVGKAKAAGQWALRHLRPRLRPTTRSSRSQATSDRVPPMVIDGSYVVITDVTNQTNQTNSTHQTTTTTTMDNEADSAANASPTTQVGEAGSGGSQAEINHQAQGNQAAEPERDVHHQNQAKEAKDATP